KLPVRICGKTSGRIPGKIGSHGGEMLRIGPALDESLQALNPVGEHERRRRKTEHGEGVLAPVHLLVGMDAAQLVDDPLERSKHRVKPGTLALENARQVDTDRANGGKQNDRVDGELQPAIYGHIRISPGTAARQ